MVDENTYELSNILLATNEKSSSRVIELLNFLRKICICTKIVLVK